MAKLPESWGLKTSRRTDGRLDIVGKDDSGKEYVARRTNGSTVTDHDIHELAVADREQYANREAGAKQIVSGIVARQEKRNAARDAAFEGECFEAANELLAQPGVLDGRHSTFGYSQRYAANFDKVFRVTDHRRVQ